MGFFGRLMSGGTKGKKSYSNGYYYGEFNASGDRHGYGTYHYNNGNVYDGYYQYGKKSGHGVMKFANGNRYEGEFEYGCYNGKGTFYYNDGSKIVATFMMDSPYQGTLYWSSSEYCTGNFSNWLLDGRCMYTKNGSTYPVLYDKGNFVRRL